MASGEEGQVKVETCPCLSGCRRPQTEGTGRRKSRLAARLRPRAESRAPGLPAPSAPVWWLTRPCPPAALHPALCHWDPCTHSLFVPGASHTCPDGSHTASVSLVPSLARPAPMHWLFICGACTLPPPLLPYLPRPRLAYSVNAHLLGRRVLWVSLGPTLSACFFFFLI